MTSAGFPCILSPDNQIAKTGGIYNDEKYLQSDCIGIGFESDGKGKIAVGSLSTDFTYKTDGDKLTLTKTVAGVSIDTEYTYKVEGEKLTLTESKTGLALEFTKKK